MPKTIFHVDLQKPWAQQDIPGHNRWHPDIPAVVSVNPGDTFRVECKDWTDGQIQNNDSASDVRNIDLSIPHVLSGPIWVTGAQPGDVLVVDILDLGPLQGNEWGFTGIFAKENGGGFLTDHFPDAYKAIWDLEGVYATSRHVPGVRMAGIRHPGLIGCAPSQELLQKWNQRERDLISAIQTRLGRGNRSGGRAVLLDTSVIIDGRIADISQTGFIDGPMLVPRFILNELQHIADSSDPLRRNRGRRGLDMLNKLQKDSVTPIEITDLDAAEFQEADAKLIALARQLGAAVITNDYNLNKVAELQGVRVLNINELANAVKTVLLPGETLRVRIIQEGKELDQGVGYLDDGTMVVIEDGKRHIGETCEVCVTRVLQTVAGRMIFAHLTEKERIRS
jgi:rRNA maturation endonuclease Nob1